MKLHAFKALLFVLFACVFVNLKAQTKTDYSEERKEVDAFFEQIFSSNTGGAAIAVVKNGEIVFDNAYGMANLEYGIPNTVNTIFHAASLSKQFTAYSILLLEQEGKLSLDDDIRTYIPEVPDFGKKITLHQLASHTSGLRDQWRLLHLAGWRSDDVILNEDIFDLVSKQKDLNFDPGTKLMYSNTGFTLLAEVVARVSGQTFAEFTQERIFTPLQMTNSQFYDDYEKVVKNRAYSYKNVDGVVKKNKLSFSTVGATSLFTTVTDLCKWAIYLNTLGETNKELSERMNTQAQLNNGELTEAAMGQWTGVKFKGLEWFDHSGSDASFRAYFSRFPEINSAVIFLGNTVPPEASASDYALAIVDGFLSEYYKKESENETTKNKAPQKIYQPIQLSTAQLSGFCGKYWEPEERYDRKILIQDDTLIYYRSESSQTKLLPVGENEFKMLNDPNDVSVFFEKDGVNGTRMRLNINDERTVIFLKYDQDFPLNNYAGNYYCPELNASLKVALKNTNLMAELSKQEAVALNAVKEDLFKSSDRHFKKIEFIKNEKGMVSGLLLSNGGASNIKYVKEN